MALETCMPKVVCWPPRRSWALRCTCTTPTLTYTSGNEKRQQNMFVVWAYTLNAFGDRDRRSVNAQPAWVTQEDLFKGEREPAAEMAQ